MNFHRAIFIILLANILVAKTVLPQKNDSNIKSENHQRKFLFGFHNILNPIHFSGGIKVSQKTKLEREFNCTHCCPNCPSEFKCGCPC